MTLTTVTSLHFLTFTFCNSYVLKLLRLETITFSDATLSNINVVFCYVLSQYHRDWDSMCFKNLEAPYAYNPNKHTVPDWKTFKYWSNKFGCMNLTKTCVATGQRCNSALKHVSLFSRPFHSLLLKKLRKFCCILQDLERKRCKVIYEEGFSEFSS